MMMWHLSSILFMWCIDLCLVPPSHSCNETYLIMVYELLNVLLNSVKHLNIFTHLLTGTNIVWAISSPCPPPSPSPTQTSHFQAEPVLPLSLILLKRRLKHNKEGKAFLLLELRTAIQRDS
jgi:hypothetical protein